MLPCPAINACLHLGFRAALRHHLTAACLRLRLEACHRASERPQPPTLTAVWLDSVQLTVLCGFAWVVLIRASRSTTVFGSMHGAQGWHSHGALAPRPRPFAGPFPSIASPFLCAYASSRSEEPTADGQVAAVTSWNPRPCKGVGPGHRGKPLQRPVACGLRARRGRLRH